MRQLYQAFIKVENAAIIIGIILTMLITFLNVVTRYVFHVGVAWSEELVRYIMIWITFIGMDIAIRTHDHVAIDFFVNRLRTKTRRWVDLGGYLVAALFCAFLFVSSLVLTVHVFQDEQITSGLQIPMGYIYSLLPLATMISTIRYLLLMAAGDHTIENTG